MRSLLNFLRSLALLVARIGLGLLLVTHAWHRYRQVGMPREVAHLAAHHVPNPDLLAWGALALEGIGGILLVLGLAVPLVGLALVVENILVIVWLKQGNGVFHHNGGFELNLVQAMLALLLAVHGSGRAGLDALFVRRRGRTDNERLTVREHA